jgi:hypothetical protein
MLGYKIAETNDHSFSIIMINFACGFEIAMIDLIPQFAPRIDLAELDLVVGICLIQGSVEFRDWTLAKTGGSTPRF